MKYHFTFHAKQKIKEIREIGFPISQAKVIKTIMHPLRVEDRIDGTIIVMILFDKTHVLRVVYRIERDIIIIITCYPGRRKAYGV